MSNKVNPNDPAFPFSWDENTKAMPGIPIRLQIAAMAMQGYCGGEYIGQAGMSHESIAIWCIEMADALIKQYNDTVE